MASAGISLLVLLSATLSALMWRCQRALLRRSPRVPAGQPPVSVLKPVKGVDDSLAANLASVFRQDYPAFEVVFAVEEADDPAVPVVRRVMSEHPGTPSRLVVGGPDVGPNPKVSNLARALRCARHGLLLVSDSNVSVEPGYLSDLVARIEEPGVGLVTSLIRGAGARGFWGRVEALQLNGFVMGGVSGLDLVLDVPCVVGKSMLLRRADLEEMGGFAFLGRHLAEDQVCGEETVARGRRVAVSGRPVDNVLGRVGFRDYVRRHVRWARIRRRMSPSGFAAEALLNPFFLSLVGMAAAPSARSAILAGGTLALLSALAASSERMLGVRRALPLYPVLEAARSVATGLLWFAPWFGSTVVWRGRRFRIGPRTRLEPLEGPAPAPLSELGPAA